MAQLTAVTLTDRKATPSSWIFTPQQIKAGVAYLSTRNGVPIGDAKMSIGLTTTASGRIKPGLRITVPILVNETINGIISPKVVRTSYVDVAFTFDATSSLAERNDVIGLLVSALSGTQPVLNDTLVNLANPY